MPPTDVRDLDRIPDGEPSEATPEKDEEEPRENQDYSELIVSLEEGDLDDAASEAFDIGIALAETEVSNPHDDIPGNLDFGTVVGEETDASVGDDDQAGPAGEDPGLFVTGGETTIGEDGDGVDESLGDLVSEQLPPLDADAHEDEEPRDELPKLEGAFDDEAPPPAERVWVGVPIAATIGPRVLVSLFGERILAAGRDVVEVNDDGSSRVIVKDTGSLVTGIVACPGSGALLIATRAGLLFRAEPSSSSGVPIVAWRDAGAVPSVGPASLAVGGPTPSARPALLVLVADAGALLETTDEGVTFRRIDLRGEVRALSTGAPPFCVVGSADTTRLVRSLPSGGFAATGSGVLEAREIIGACAEGSTVVIRDAALGVFVSADSGATFRRSPHTRNATAIAAGRVNGSPMVFSAILGADGTRTTLVCIDARTAEARTIAEIREPADDDGESAHVQSLAWDGNTATLWAAGAFGLRRFRSPPSA